MFKKVKRQIFGVDIFISYSRKDATVYAERLAVILQEKGYRCYLDKWKSEPGKNNSDTILSTLRHASMMVILGTENATKSRSISEEVESFLQTKRVIVPINFGYVTDNKPVERQRTIGQAPWYCEIRGLAITDEDSKSLEKNEPSELVVKRIINSFIYLKQSQRLQRATITSFVVLLSLLILITYSFYKAADLNKTIANRNRDLKEINEQELISLAHKYIDINPKISLAVVKALMTIDSITYAPEIRDIVMQTLFKNVSYVDIITNNRPFHGTTAIPDFEKPNLIFATDTNVRFIVFGDSSGNRISIKDIDRDTIISTLDLADNQEFITPKPITTSLIAILTKSLNGNYVDVYDIHTGFTKPITRLIDVVDIKFAGGNWPCFVMHSNGAIDRISTTATNTLEKNTICNNQPGYKIEVHPSGASLCVYADDSTIKWVGLDVASKKWKAVTVSVHTENKWDYSVNNIASPIVKWGREPSQILALEFRQAPPKTDGLQMNLLAIDPLVGSKQIIYKSIFRSTGLSIPVLETDKNCSKIIINISYDRGTLAYAFKLKWDNHKKAVAAFSEEGRLEGTLNAQSEANVVSMAISPNGNYALVSSDVRGTSATQSGKGRLECWGIYELDEESSAQPDAAELFCTDKATVKSIAYSSNSKRVACIDQQNNIHVYNVRENALSTEQFFSGKIRFSDSAYEQLMTPKPQILGNSSQIWRVNYPNGFVNLYDLNNGNEIRLNNLVPGQKILDVSNEGEITTVVSTNWLFQINTGGIIKRIKLRNSATSATIGYRVISIKGEKMLTFFDKQTLNEIGYCTIDTGGIFKQIKFDGNWYFNDRSYYFYVADRQINTENISTFSFEKNAKRRVICRWDMTSQASGLLRIDKVWEIEVPCNDNDWFSLRRSPNTSVLLVLTGNDDSEPTLHQVDIKTGNIVTKYQPPLGGWPHQMFEVSDYFSISTLQTCIVFRIFTYESSQNYSETYGYGIWDEHSGKCLSWNSVGNCRVYIPRSKDQFDKVNFIVFRTNEKSKDSALRIINITTSEDTYTGIDKQRPLSYEGLLNKTEEKDDDAESNNLPSNYLYYRQNEVVKVKSDVIKLIESKIILGGIDWTTLPINFALPKEFIDKINSIKSLK